MPAKSVTKIVKKFVQDLQNCGFGGPPWKLKTGRESIWRHHFVKRWGLVAQKAHRIRFWAPKNLRITTNYPNNYGKRPPTWGPRLQKRVKSFPDPQNINTKKTWQPQPSKFIHIHKKWLECEMELNRALKHTPLKNICQKQARTKKREHFPLPVRTR